MDENPYLAPGDGQRQLPKQRSTLAALCIGFGAAIGISCALAVVAAVVAFFAISRIDFRENPRYWDEIELREKMEMTREEAAKSISEETRTRQQ